MKLSISQPALSIQIKKLEDEIGIKLFNRSKTPIQITNDGIGFLIRAEDVVVKAQKLEKFAEDLNKTYKGILKIGIIPTLAPFLVPLFAGSMQGAHPELDLDIYELITNNVIYGVRNGDLDVGIISTPLTAYGIQTKALFYEKFFFYAADKQTSNFIDPQKINYSKLWILEEGNCFRDQINNFCDLGRIRENKPFIYRSNSIDALIRVVDTRGGITILPELTTLTLSKEQESNLKRISGKPKAREIGIITRTEYDKERFIDKLEVHIKKNIPRSMLSSKGLEVVDPGISIT
jgi:LysR family hydrogen peroxide-inducible transcriptional activator